jgi:hypothetical protein
LEHLFAYFVYFAVQNFVESKPTITEIKDAACERCGSFDVLEIAGQFLCADCVATAGCGCAGHGNSSED